MVVRDLVDAETILNLSIATGVMASSMTIVYGVIIGSCNPGVGYWYILITMLIAHLFAMSVVIIKVDLFDTLSEAVVGWGYLFVCLILWPVTLMRHIYVKYTG